MFEKEATERTKEKYNFQSFITREQGKELWRDGAEFGYNKANEWHKQEVDDIYDTIPQDWSVKYFICIMKDKSRVPAMGSCDEGCNGEVSVNLFFEYDDEKYYIDDIVWWKEIVLPGEN